MKNRNSKFIPLYETIYNRYKSGSGFLEGDLVKLKEGYKGTEEYKSLAETVKARLQNAVESGLNLRLGRLHTPQASVGGYGTNPGLPATHADLYQEMAPGNFGNLVTVPIALLETIDTGVNLSPISPKQKRPTTSYKDPTELGAQLSEVEEGENENPMTDEQTAVARSQHYIHKKRDGHDGNYKLGKENVKLPVGANKVDLTKPSTNWKPMKGNQRMPEKLGKGDVYYESTVPTTRVNKKSLAVLTEVYAGIWNEDEDVYSHGLPTDPDSQGEPTHTDGVGYNYEIEEHMVKPEHWDKENNCPKGTCWNPDGSFKEECWNVQEDLAPGTAAGMPGGDPAQINNNQKDPEQTSAL